MSQKIKKKKTTTHTSVSTDQMEQTDLKSLNTTT